MAGKTVKELIDQMVMHQSQPNPPLRTESSLRTDYSADYLDRLLNAHRAKFYDVCLDQFGKDPFTWRDIQPSDLKGYTVEEFIETGSTDNTWTDMTMGGGNAIADDTAIMIWALQYFAETASTTARFPSNSGWRFKVGSTIRAQFSGSHLWAGNVVTTGTSAGSPIPGSKMAYLTTPLVITKNQPFTGQEYNITATEVYRLLVFGLTAEKAGKSIEG